MVDYGKSGNPRRNSKEPQDRTSKKGQPGGTPDKSELLARMKAAAEKKKQQD